MAPAETTSARGEAGDKLPGAAAPASTSPGSPEETEVQEDVYSMSSTEAAKYSEVFARLDTDNSGFISGSEAVVLFKKSALPRDKLAAIWALADQDKDGKLSREEFRIAMHLILCVGKKKMELPKDGTVPASLRLKKKKKKKGKDKANIKTKNKNSQQQKLETGSSAAKPGAGAGAGGGSPGKRRPRPSGSSTAPALAVGDTAAGSSKYAKVGLEDEAAVLRMGGTSTDRRPSLREVREASLLGEVDHSDAYTIGCPTKEQHEQQQQLLLQPQGVGGGGVEGGKAAAPTATRKSGQGGQGGEMAVDGGGGGGADGAEEPQPEQQQREGPEKPKEPKEPPKKPKRVYGHIRPDGVDNVHVESAAAKKALRDIQSNQVLLSNLGYLKTQEEDRRRELRALDPVAAAAARRASLDDPKHAHLAAQPGFIDLNAPPGAGGKAATVPRRVSQAIVSSDPAIQGLRQRAEAAAEFEQERLGERDKALNKWGVSTPSAGAPVLSLASRPLLVDDFAILALILKQNLPFPCMDMTRCFLKDANFFTLMNAMSFSSSLHTLILDRSGVSNSAVNSLAEMLTLNKSLTSVSLRDCKDLTRETWDDLLEAIQEGGGRVKKLNGLSIKKLRTSTSPLLSLEGQGVAYTEALILSHCLKARSKQGLKEVNLSHNKLCTASFYVLLEGLQEFDSICSIDLSHNRLDELVLQPLLGTLVSRNKGCTMVTLGNNFIQASEYEPCGMGLLLLLSSPSLLHLTKLEGLVEEEGEEEEEKEKKMGEGKGKTKSKDNSTSNSNSRSNTNRLSPGLARQAREKLAVNRAVKGGTREFLDCIDDKIKPAEVQIAAPARNDPKVLFHVDPHFVQQEHLQIEAGELVLAGSEGEQASSGKRGSGWAVDNFYRRRAKPGTSGGSDQ